MRTGRVLGATTILNPAPVRDYPADLLASVDYVIPNEHEAALLTGMATETLADATAAARELARRSGGCAVITRGGKGLVWATETSTGSAGVFPVTPLDTVAAGDAFCGGLAAALAQGLELPEALRWASATGALATTVAGAVPSLPTRAAVQALLDANPL
jgi:ribokinase